MDKVWLTVDEVAEYLNCSRATVYNMVSDGKLKIRKVNRLSRIKKEDVDRLFEES